MSLICRRSRGLSPSIATTHRRCNFVPTKLSKISIRLAEFHRRTRRECTCRLRHPHPRLLIPTKPRENCLILAGLRGEKNLIGGSLTRQRNAILFRDLAASCGEEGSRTPDLLLAKQALSQLSYFPDLSGLTPPVCCVCAYLDSNQGPQLYQSCALAN